MVDALQAGVLLRLLRPEHAPWKAYMRHWFNTIPPPFAGLRALLSPHAPLHQHLPDRVHHYALSLRRCRPHRLALPQDMSDAEVYAEPLFGNPSVAVQGAPLLPSLFPCMVAAQVHTVGGLLAWTTHHPSPSAGHQAEILALLAALPPSWQARPPSTAPSQQNDGVPAELPMGLEVQAWGLGGQPFASSTTQHRRRRLTQYASALAVAGAGGWAFTPDSPLRPMSWGAGLGALQQCWREEIPAAPVRRTHAEMQAPDPHLLATTAWMRQPEAARPAPADRAQRARLDRADADGDRSSLPLRRRLVLQQQQRPRRHPRRRGAPEGQPLQRQHRQRLVLQRRQAEQVLRLAQQGQEQGQQQGQQGQQRIGQRQRVRAGFDDRWVVTFDDPLGGRKAPDRTEWGAAWKRLQRVPVPRHHRFLAWRILHASLPVAVREARRLFTGHQDARRHAMCHHPGCVGDQAMEDISHVFLVCPVAVHVWAWVCRLWAAVSSGGIPPCTEPVVLCGDLCAWDPGPRGLRQL